MWRSQKRNLSLFVTLQNPPEVLGWAAAHITWIILLVATFSRNRGSSVWAFIIHFRAAEQLQKTLLVAIITDPNQTWSWNSSISLNLASWQTSNLTIWTSSLASLWSSPSCYCFISMVKACIMTQETISREIKTRISKDVACLDEPWPQSCFSALTKRWCRTDDS